MNKFEEVYESAIDARVKIAWWYTRIPKYYILKAPKIDFSTDVVIDIGAPRGLIWDVAASTDVDDWSMTIFTKPDQAPGSIDAADMTKWALSYVMTTGKVASKFYKYQHYEMSPIFFHHLYPENDNQLYLRFDGNPSEVNLRITMSRF